MCASRLHPNHCYLGYSLDRVRVSFRFLEQSQTYLCTGLPECAASTTRKSYYRFFSRTPVQIYWPLGSRRSCPLRPSRLCRQILRRSMYFCCSLRKKSLTPIRRVWEAKIVDTLQRRADKKSDYILLRSHQVCYPKYGM